MTRVAIAHACAELLFSFLIALPHRAFGYRPFISTDAAVADVDSAALWRRSSQLKPTARSLVTRALLDKRQWQ
jgi:hypothetical protein